MNKAAIKAELRRSACEDLEPYHGCSFNAFNVACEYKSEPIFSYEHDVWRFFFLMVAEEL